MIQRTESLNVARVSSSWAASGTLAPRQTWRELPARASTATNASTTERPWHELPTRASTTTNARPAKRTFSALDADRAYFGEMKHHLAQGHGACWLRDPEIAKMVRAAILCFDGQRYQAGELAIPPNHVHVLVRPLAVYDLEQVLHSWKSFSAKAINKRVGRSGSVWQHESYDRLVRDTTELRRTERYIRNNLLPADKRDPG